MRKPLLALSPLMLLGLTACGGNGHNDPAGDDPAEATTPARLSAFANDRELDMGLAQEFSGEQPSSVQNRSYSATNLQEQGVDEADRVKSDGNYLYLYLVPVFQG